MKYGRPSFCVRFGLEVFARRIIPKSKDSYAPSLAESFVSFLLLFLRFHELTHSCNKSFFLQSSSGKSSQDEGLVYWGKIPNNSKLMLKRKQTKTVMMMAMKMTTRMTTSMTMAMLIVITLLMIITMRIIMMTITIRSYKECFHWMPYSMWSLYNNWKFIPTWASLSLLWKRR